MTRLLSVLLLTVFLAGFGGASVHAGAAGPDGAALGQAGGESGGRMAMSCPACPMTGACAASEPAQFVPSAAERLKFFQPSSQIADLIRAPDTAPPKRSSA